MKDEFIESLTIPEEELAKPDRQQEGPKTSRQKKEEFCMFPFHVMASIAKTGTTVGGVVRVLAALFELWFRDNHYNPVKLTTASLRKYEVSPDQKLRALRFLEKSGQVSVDRSNGKNPWVTLKWLPLKTPPVE